MPSSFSAGGIEGLVLVESRIFRDERGAFLESYKRSEFTAGGIDEVFVQDNSSVSARGVIRGLHMQVAPYAQAKLVRVAMGAVWDVAVDLRPGSATYGRWLGVELSDSNGRAMYIPAGFLHGFQALTDGAVLTYKCSAEYDKDSERGVRWDDPVLSIAWPLAAEGVEAIVSEKDALLPGLAEFEAAGGIDADGVGTMDGSR